MRWFLHILSYPLSVVFYLMFGLLLVLFDPIQRICLFIFGYKAHKISVDIFNGSLILILYLLGTTVKFNKPKELPKNAPVIIASNHQSMWDIPPLIWYLRRLHPKFIAKIELSKGVPTISFNLKHGGSVAIDRKDPDQAMAQIEKIAKYIETYNRSVVIFPEGTRSRTGIPKEFKKKGLQTLFTHAPNAWVLPVTVNNSWKLQRNGLFPIPLFSRLKFKTHPLFKVSDYQPEELITLIEDTITASVVVKD